MVEIKLENIADLSIGAYRGVVGSFQKDVATLLRLYTPRKRDLIMMIQEKKIPTTISGVVGEGVGILSYKTAVAAAAVYSAYHLVGKLVS